MSYARMENRRLKEDMVNQVSTSIFVTNFPDQFSFRDLWKECDVYGKVIDVYIPNRRSKTGKRFGFVRFIKINDVERLVNNLCTIWVGRFKLHANVVRFQRQPMKNVRTDANEVKNKSYVYAVKKGIVNYDVEEDKKPAIVLDESGFSQRDFSLSLMGKVKEFSSLSNLKIVLASEAKENFKSHVGIGSWFSILQQASCSLNLDGRVAWVDIEGVPLKVWTKNTFTRIISKWGELVYEEEKEMSCLHRKRVCIKTTLEENIFESFKIIVQGKVYWVRAKEVNGWSTNFIEEDDNDNDSMDDNSIGENDSVHKNTRSEEDSDVQEIPETIFEQKHAENLKMKAKNEEMKGVQSEDPFSIYELLEKKQRNRNEGVQLDDTLKYPPGFTPRADREINSNELDKETGEENKDVQRSNENEGDSGVRNVRNLQSVYRTTVAFVSVRYKEVKLL
ncbi:hypothetical protein CTI12_AA121160 [Artemisia annua]|uniref:RRM domain-containing protein n=1 Tax=Artemisia annua TaxID=35608 RepID=A0A2U1PQC7_ARTAN|nr:hypothetical protein CTI12_AA121160 [Artemisia annua]